MDKGYTKGRAMLESGTKNGRRSGRTEAELVFAIHQDECKLGRPHRPSERDAFTRGFFGQEYAGEIRMLAAAGLLDDEDDES
jgi:hypothetical protein